MYNLLSVLVICFAFSSCVIEKRHNARVQGLNGNTCQQTELATTLTQLRQAGVDSIMTFLYDYDNGTVEDAVYHIVWIKKKQGFIKTLRNCTIPSIAVQTSNKVGSLFAFYTQNKFWDLPELQRCNQSHDMGYYIVVYLPNKVGHYNVRNCQRHQLKKVGKALPGEAPKQLEKDPRSVLVDMLEGFIK
ncbi:hypothetical protein [Hymenobacter sp. UYP22]|uniref:hypothetical protein n=1 Tax=Hymenobacter sp. UYP22 TaxID=3156348 RepID=UPI00339A308D